LGIYEASLGKGDLADHPEIGHPAARIPLLAAPFGLAAEKIGAPLFRGRPLKQKIAPVTVDRTDILLPIQVRLIEIVALGRLFKDAVDHELGGMVTHAAHVKGCVTAQFFFSPIEQFLSRCL
jgi:hypothetical protein